MLAIVNYRPPPVFDRRANFAFVSFLSAKFSQSSWPTKALGLAERGQQCRQVQSCGVCLRSCGAVHASRHILTIDRMRPACQSCRIGLCSRTGLVPEISNDTKKSYLNPTELGDFCAPRNSWLCCWAPCTASLQRYRWPVGCIAYSCSS